MSTPCASREVKARARDAERWRSVCARARCSSAVSFWATGLPQGAPAPQLPLLDLVVALLSAGVEKRHGPRERGVVALGPLRRRMLALAPGQGELQLWIAPQRGAPFLVPLRRLGEVEIELA